ncbi:MAG: hypothetical protein HQM13_16090, partial [SAR324 cluster bacterium]|nr:hypothetical protein [SAR324 cluster bacterium]
MNQRKKWKVWSIVLILAGVLAFAGCQKGIVEGDEGSTETHVEGENNTAGNVELVDLSNYPVTIHGIVTDDLGYPLEGATVAAAGSSTTTASTGLYTLTDIPVNQTVSNSALTAAAAGGGGSNSTLATIPVSVILDGYTTGVVYVGAHAVINDSANASAAGIQSPNTVILVGMTADSGDISLNRLAAIVRGKITNNLTGQAAKNLTITIVPVSNNVTSISGSPAAGTASGHTNGEVTWGHKASTLVATTGSDGRYTFTGIAVNTVFDIFVTSEDYQGAGGSFLVNARESANARTIAANDSTDGNTNSTDATVCGGASPVSSCLGTVTTSAGIVDVPELRVTPIKGSTIADTTSPTIIYMTGGDLATASSSYFSGSGYMQLDENAFTVESSSLTASDLVLTFSEPLQSGRFNASTSVTGDSASVVVYDTTSDTTLSVDSTGTVLDTANGTLTLKLSSASSVVTPGSQLYIRLKTDNFVDSNGNRLSASTNINSDDVTSNNPTSVSSGYLTLNVRTHKRLSSTATTISDLAQVAFSALSSVSNQEDYSGLYKYSAPSKLYDPNNSDADLGAIGIRPGAGANDIVQLNAAAAGPLATLATSLTQTTHTSDKNFAHLTFTAVSGKSYKVTVKNSLGTAWTSTTLGTTNNSSGGNDSAGGGIVAGDTTSLAHTLNTSGQFTANGTSQNLWLDGVTAGYTVKVEPLNDFGDAVTSQGQTVTLVDVFPPVVTIMENKEPLTTAGSTPSSSSQVDTGGGVYDTGTGAGIGYPVIELGGRYYAETARTATNGTTSLLGRSNRYYTAANYATWTAARTAKTAVVDMSESLTSSSVSASILRGNTSTTPSTDSSLQLALTGITAASVNTTTSSSVNSSSNFLLVTLGDWREISDLAFMNITGVTDTAGNAADTTTGVLFVDRTPAIMTALTIGGSSISMTFDQEINATFSGYSDGTTVLTIQENNPFNINSAYGIGNSTTYEFRTDTETSTTAPAGLLVRRTGLQAFQDLYTNSIASGSASPTTFVQAEAVNLSSDSKSLTIVVSPSTVDPTASSPSASNSSAKMDSFFSDVS